MKQQLKYFIGNEFVDVVENFKYDEEGKKTDVKMVLVTIYSKERPKEFLNVKVNEH